MKGKRIVVIEKETAMLCDADFSEALGPNQVRGRTLATVISPGTEIAAFYRGDNFPGNPGYAAVFEVSDIGSDVSGIQKEDRIFCMGSHQSVQQVDASEAVKVPDSLKPETAVMARLMGVSMTTLMTTDARPGEMVFVAGAGPVGYLAAHMLKNSGYRVHVAEPNPARQKMVRESGITAVFDSLPVDDPAYTGEVALVVECSGHETAVMDSCRLVRRKGEVVMVGVPWRQHVDTAVHELLDIIFRRYVVLRSGWEWELPRQSSHQCPNSIFSGFRTALQWLKEKRMPIESLLRIHQPESAQAIYQDLINSNEEGLFQVFDWSGCAH